MHGELILSALLLLASIGGIGGELSLNDETPQVEGESSLDTLEAADAQAVDESDAIFREVETDESQFVAEVDMSLLGSGFDHGEELRIVTGGSVDDERVVWFDIGITRSADGFETKADMMINFPSMGA
ncbi:MAG: hypothetical protein PPP58_00335 [Natronomonas sp.]